MKVDVQKNILDANDNQAAINRDYFKSKNLFVLNLMSSPGAGKTALLCNTLNRLMPDIRAGVLVGDICTANDAERIKSTGVIAHQINTDQFGGACHLDADLVLASAKQLGCDNIDILVVENIGNLVCPAEFDIGEDAKVVVLSVTEGEDKPVKYPLMFRVSDVALLNKIDLLPYLDYDVELAVRNIKKIHSDIALFKTSAVTGDGLEPWIEWIKEKVMKKKKTDFQI